MKTAFSITMFCAFFASKSFAVNTRVVASAKPVNLQVSHARELLGENYSKTISRIAKMKNIEAKVLATVKESLPKKFKGSATVVTKAIMNESKKHGLDPYFVMAVIAGESSFNPLAVGPVGEIGMMQIRPTTAEWLCKKMKITWRGEKSLENPVTNIKIGTAYLSMLRRQFDYQGQLYLAAYNMGARSVKRALDKNIRPKDYPIHVMKRYIAFYKAI